MQFVDEGTRVLLTCREASVQAEVLLASSDCRSLVVKFDGTVGPYHGLIHLIWLEDGYADLFMGEYVGLVSFVELCTAVRPQTVRVWIHREVSTAGPLMEASNGEPL